MVAIRRTIKEAPLVVAYSMLTNTNYPKWALVIGSTSRINLWEVVEPDDAEYHYDRLALVVILRAVLQKMLTFLALKKTAKDDKEAVKTIQMGVQRVCVANAHMLRDYLADITFKDGEAVDGFSLWISGLKQPLTLRRWHFRQRGSEENAASRLGPVYADGDFDQDVA